MTEKKKHASRYIIAALILVLVTAAAVIMYKKKPAVSEQTEALAINSKIDLPVKTKEKKDKIRTNNDIKEKYGRLETVYLRDGSSYTGAVVISKEMYSIVTVKGVYNFMMSDVLKREIIR